MATDIPTFNKQASANLWRASNNQSPPLTLQQLTYYLSQGADINVVNPENFNNSAFLLIVGHQFQSHNASFDLVNFFDTPIIQKFLQGKVNVNAANSGGFTAAHWLLSFGSHDSSAAFALNNSKYGFEFFASNAKGLDPMEITLLKRNFSSALGFLKHVELSNYLDTSAAQTKLEKYSQILTKQAPTLTSNEDPSHQQIEELRISIEKKLLLLAVQAPLDKPQRVRRETVKI